MSDPIVDVLMTAHNSEAFIRISIDSILKQTLKSILLHVIDDGSIDNTRSIIENIALVDNRVILYARENSGVSRSSNFGLSKCRAEFIARMDSDDISYPERLERQVDILRKNLDTLAVSGNAHQINMEGVRLPGGAFFSAPSLADPRFVPAREPYLLHPFLMVRREAMEHVNGYRDLIVSEDTDLYWRLSELGKLYNDDYIYGSYRLNSDSLSSRSIDHGRIMAIYSQLAAVSAVRRRSGKPDINFTESYAAAIRSKGGSLENILKVAAEQLEPNEVTWFRYAVSAKLLELSGYRPYEIESKDCSIIGEIFDDVKKICTSQNKSKIIRTYNGTAVRLALNERWKDARTLLSGNFGVSFWTRFLVKKAKNSLG